MILNVDAEKRVTQRKSDLTELRKKGYIPAVIYGEGTDPISIALNKAEFGKIYKKSIGELAFFDLNVEGKKYHTILKDKQIHPVGRHFLHLDFMAVKAKTHVEIDVPIKFVGEPIGIKTGGIMDVIQRTVKISCLANQIPEDIEVDISKLGVGDSIHISGLPQGKWQYKDHSDVTLIVIHAKKGDTTTQAETEPESKDKE